MLSLVKKEGFKIEKFKKLIEAIKDCNKSDKIKRIEQLMTYNPLINHYSTNGFHILAESDVLEYPHEVHTSKKLINEGYHVVFVPKGYFSRAEKKFDVFLFKKHIIFEADLKCITSDNPDTIGNRIKEGSEQAKRLVIDIHATIGKNKLIEGLRTGCARNENIVEILLFYNGRFYTLQKNQIMNNKIYDTIK